MPPWACTSTAAESQPAAVIFAHGIRDIAPLSSGRRALAECRWTAQHRELEVFLMTQPRVAVRAIVPVVIGLLVVLVPTAVSAVGGATINVTTRADGVRADSACGLRE